MPSPIAFIIPPLNEEAAIAPMLDGLRAALDAAACADADIVVVDNGSRDATTSLARKHGAVDHRQVWSLQPVAQAFEA
jgi:glycosyltransferase involved in cell wall biosynthesis